VLLLTPDTRLCGTTAVLPTALGDHCAVVLSRCAVAGVLISPSGEGAWGIIGLLQGMAATRFSLCSYACICITLSGAGCCLELYVNGANLLLVWLNQRVRCTSSSTAADSLRRWSATMVAPPWRLDAQSLHVPPGCLVVQHGEVQPLVAACLLLRRSRCGVLHYLPDAVQLLVSLLRLMFRRACSHASTAHVGSHIIEGCGWRTEVMPHAGVLPTSNLRSVGTGYHVLAWIMSSAVDHACCVLECGAGTLAPSSVTLTYSKLPYDSKWGAFLAVFTAKPVACKFSGSS
jgi:hypothetical protein